MHSWAPYPESLVQQVWLGAQESAFLTRLQGMGMLGVLAPRFKQPCSKVLSNSKSLGFKNLVSTMCEIPQSPGFQGIPQVQNHRKGISSPAPAYPPSARSSAHLGPQAAAPHTHRTSPGSGAAHNPRDQRPALPRSAGRRRRTGGSARKAGSALRRGRWYPAAALYSRC